MTRPALTSTGHFRAAARPLRLRVMAGHRVAKRVCGRVVRSGLGVASPSLPKSRVGSVLREVLLVETASFLRGKGKRVLIADVGQTSVL